MASIQTEPWFVKELKGTVEYEGILPMLHDIGFLFITINFTYIIDIYEKIGFNTIPSRV